MDTSSSRLPLLEDVLPDLDAVHRRLHIIAREHSLLKRLLTLAIKGRDEVAYRLAEQARQSNAPADAAKEVQS